MRRFTTPLHLIIGALVLAIAVSACDLTKMNENPNAPTTPDVDALMVNAMRDFSNYYYDDNFTMRGSNLLAQYTTQNFYPTESTYASLIRPWDEIYYPLNDLKTVIELNREDPSISASPTNYIAVSQISQAFMFHVLTDYYGDVPYQEALSGQDNFAPAYTPQSEIYPALLDSLDSAIGNIAPSQPGPEGDVIFGGDMEKWERFANSLKLRIAMRMEDQNGASGVLNDQAVYDNAMQSNADNAYFQFSTSAVHRSDIYDNRYVDGRDDFDASDRFVNALQQYSTTDPRADVYFDKDINGGYTGFPYGLQQPAAQDLYSSNLPSENFSRVGDRFLRADAEALWMNYDETLFIQAEAASKGYISGNPNALLEEAIRANMARWDLDPNSAQADAYIAEVMNDISNTSFQQVLGEQKWIAFYFQGIQGWSTWRRLDFTDWILPPTGGNQGAYAQQGQSGVPLRFDYPQSEFSLNGENVRAAAQSQFGGTQSETPIQRVWWDTNPPPAEANVQ